MLVDDEPLILEGLRNIIDWDSIGFTVIATARNGREALEISRKTQFDVLITDIKMPELTGLELIEALNQESKHIKTIILSGFQEFDLVKKGLKLGIENYLLKPINETELISSLLHVKEKINRETLEEESILVLRDHSIWRWMMGKMEYHDFKERLSFYPAVQFIPPLWIGLLKLEWEEQNEHFLQSLQMKIEQDTSAVAVLTPLGDILLIWSNGTEDGWEIEKRKFFSLVESAVKDREYVAALSEKVDSFQEVPQVYQELERACELKMLLHDKDHNMAEQMYLITPQIKMDTGNQANNYLKPEILEQLANQQYGLVKEYLNKVFSLLEQDKQVLVMKSILLEFFFQVKNKFFVYLEYSHYVETIYQILYIETKQDALTIVDRCMGMIEKDSVKEEEKSPIIQTVLSYIHHNFSEDMSLKTLGHSFHINPIYLGQLFQKEVRCSFTKYLNKLRIDRAKKLLLNSYEKAGHIGKKVGYTDATYFYKQFKKYENVTPSEWRKQHMQV
jgi:two-component system response regulator YesN